MDGAAQIARRWIDLYNDPDAFGSDRFFDLYAEDVDWQEMPAAGGSGDRAALRAAIASGQAVLRNRHAELEELVVDSSDQVCAFRFKGTANLAIDIPPRAAGTPVEGRIAQFFEVRNGLIVRSLQYSVSSAGSRPSRQLSDQDQRPESESTDWGDRRVRGSCLCGTVSFELDKAGIFGTNACFCSYCRKVAGSQFGVYLHVRPESFRWLSGKDQVGAFDSSPGNQRCFCRICGCVAPTVTSLEARVPGGALDDDPGVAPTVNIYTASSARWCAADAAQQTFALGAR